MAGESSVICWLNSFLSRDTVKSLEELSNGKHLCTLAAIINPIKWEYEDSGDSNLIEERFTYIKESINGHYHIDSSKFIDFNLLKDGKPSEIVKASLLLMSAIVIRSYRVSDLSLLNPLHDLQINTQVYIRDCLELILAADNESKLHTALSKMSSFANAEGFSTPKRTSNRSQATPLSEDSNNVSRMVFSTPLLRKQRSFRKKKNKLVSPLKVFIESPSLRHQILMKEKTQEITELRKLLNTEENLTFELDQKYNTLLSELHNKDEEIKELKEKIYCLRTFQDQVEESENTKAELEMRIEALEEKCRNCEKCKFLELEMKCLEDEVRKLQESKEDNTEQKQKTQDQMKILEEENKEKNLEIITLKIEISENQAKNEELVQQVQQLKSCLDLYKKKCSKENSDDWNYFIDPCQTSLKSDGESLKGIVDKKNQELEEELEQKNYQMQELIDKLKELKVWNECSDELNASTYSLTESFSDDSFVKLAGKGDSIPMKSVIKSLESFIADLKIQLSNKEQEFVNIVNEHSNCDVKYCELTTELTQSKEKWEAAMKEKETLVEELNSEISSQKNTIVDINSQLDNLKGSLVAMQKEYADIKLEGDRGVKTIEELDQKLLEKIDTCDNITCEFNKQIEGLTKEITELRTNYESVSKEKDNYIVELQQLKEELSEKIELHGQQIQSYEVHVKELKEDILNSEICLRDVQIEKDEYITKIKQEYSEKISVYEQKIQDSSLQISASNERIKELEEENEYNRKEKDEKSSLVANLEEELLEKVNLHKKVTEDYELQIKKLNDKVVNVEETLEHIQKEHDNSSNEVQHLKNELLSKNNLYDKEIENYKIIIEKLKEEILYLEVNSKNIGKEKDNSDVKILNLLEQANCHNQKIEKYELQISNLNDKIIAMEMEYESAKMEILKNVSKVNQLEQDLAEKNMSHKTEIEGYKLCIEKLNEKIETAEKNYLNIQQQNNENVTKITKLEQETMENMDLHKDNILCYESKISDLFNKIELLERNYSLSQEEKNSETEKVKQLEEKLTENLNLHEVEVNNYKMLMGEIQEKFIDAQQCCQDAEQEKECNIKKISQLEQKLSEGEKDILSYKLDIQKLNDAIAELKITYNQVQQAKDDITEELMRSEKKNQMLSAEYELLNQNYQETLSKSAAFEKTSCEHLSCSESPALNIKIENASLKAWEECQNRSEECNITLENENKLLLNQIETLKEKCDLVKEKQIAIEQMKCKICQCENTIESQVSLINELKEEVNKVQQENSEVLSEIEILKQQKLNEFQNIQQLESKNKELVGELEILRRNYEAELSDKNYMSENLSHKERTIEEQEKIICDHNEEIKILKENSKNIQNEFKNLSIQFTALENEKNQLSNELEKIKAEKVNCTTLITVDNEKTKLLDTLHRILKDYDENKDNIKLIQDPLLMISELEKRLKLLKEINKKMQIDTEVEHKKLSEVESENSQLHSELKQLKINFEKTSLENETLKKQTQKQRDCHLKNIEDIKLGISKLNQKFIAVKCDNVSGEIPCEIGCDENQILDELNKLEFKWEKCVEENEKLYYQKDEELSNLKTQLHEKCEEFEEMKEDLNAKEKALQDIKEKLELPKKLLLKMKEENEKNLQQKLKDLKLEKNKEIAKLNQEKDEIKKNLETLKEKSKKELIEKNEEIKKMQHHLKTYKNIAKSATEDVKMLTEQAKDVHKKDELENTQLTTKYVRAKELINKLKGENEELKKSLAVNAKFIAEKELLKEKNHILKTELEACRQSISPLRTRIHVIEKAFQKQEEENKDLQKQLNVALHEIKNLKEAAEKDDLKRRLSFSVSDSCDFKSSPSLRIKRNQGLRERNSFYVKDDVFKKPLNDLSSVSSTPRFEHSFTSTTSGGFNRSILGGATHFQCADEEEYLLHSSLENIGPSRSNSTKVDDRLNELQRRNTLCPPHMRSSYPVEMQLQSPSKFSDSALKAGRVVKEKSPKRKLNSATDLSQKPTKKPVVVTKKSKLFRRSIRGTPTSYSPFFPGRTDSSIKRLYQRIKRSKATPPRK